MSSDRKKKVFFVEITIGGIVVADDESQVDGIVTNYEFVVDNDGEVSYVYEIKSLEQLEGTGWSKNDTPYSVYYDRDVKDKCLAELLPEKEPYVDKWTVDMFDPHLIKE